MNRNTRRNSKQRAAGVPPADQTQPSAQPSGPGRDISTSALRLPPDLAADCDAQQAEPPTVEPSHPVLQVVAAHLRQHKFNYAILSSGSGLLFSMCDKTLSWITSVTAIEDKAMLCLRCRLPLLAPASRRGAVAAFLTCLNFGSLIGSWQMDPDDGEVMYSTNHLFGDQDPTEKHIKILMMVSMNAMCDEGPQILRLMQRPSRPTRTPSDPSRN